MFTNDKSQSVNKNLERTNFLISTLSDQETFLIRLPIAGLKEALEVLR